MKFEYKPELDVIKFFCVILFVLFGANLKYADQNLFQGGFLGVDFFFVISGYLITSLILKELSLTGSFSLKNFYERRAQKILPQFIIVMIISSAFAWKYLLPSSLVDYAKSLLYSVGFISNFYYPENHEINIIKSTSVLSILVQFYLIFPIFLTFLIKNLKNKTLLFLIILLISSLCFSIFSFSGNENHLFAKLWLFIIGSVLFLKLDILQSFKKGLLRNNLIIYFSIVLIFIFAFFYEKINQYSPIVYFLVISAFCYLMIYLKDNKYLYKFLTTNFLVKISCISYPIFLTHLLVFDFSKAINFTQGDVTKKIVIVTIILVLSFSIFLVSKKYNFKKEKEKNNFFWITISPLVLIITFNILVIYNNGFSKRFPQLISSNFNNGPIYNKLKQSDEICFGRIYDFCNFNKDSKKKIIMIGDSHMGSLMHSLKDSLIEKDYNFIPITKGGFIFLPETTTINYSTRKKNIDYETINKNIKFLLEDLKNQTVIIGGMFSLYIYEKRFIRDNQVLRGSFGSVYLRNETAVHEVEFLEEEFKKMIKNILRRNKVILVYPIPNPDIHIKKHLLKISNLREKLKKNQYLLTSSYKDYLTINADVLKLFDNLEDKNLFKVFPQKIFCDNKIKNRCILHDRNNLYFENSWHPSEKGAQLINDKILNSIEFIEEKNNIQ